MRPLPRKYGVGFVCDEAQPQLQGYRYEQVGRYHNYHVTAKAWRWPKAYPTPFGGIIDGFSPNLNKNLHVGHLRNLFLANAVSRIAQMEPVALLGASLGVKRSAIDLFGQWCWYLQYNPRLFYDAALPTDIDLGLRPATLEEAGIDSTTVGVPTLPLVWDGPKGPVIAVRSDGRPTYAHHDLVFAAWIKPRYYITGLEQKDHFESLGLGEKHLPMGLVLGSDGKKLKSRTGDALTAIEAVDAVKDKLRETPQPRELAINILIWNFLSPARESNLKFEAETWVKAESPGMHISYTLARLKSVLPQWHFMDPFPEAVEEADAHSKGAQEIDVQLMGMAAQYAYWYNQAVVKLDPSPLANYAKDLAREISSAYHKERIEDGRDSFRGSISFAGHTLEKCMIDLGMVPLVKV